MIIENQIEEREKIINKLKDLLKDLKLPSKFYIEYNDDYYKSFASIIEKYKFFGILPSTEQVACINFYNDKIIINFEGVTGLKYFYELEEYLKNSTISNILIIKINSKDYY